ncbi:hypothetical protein PoB_007124100 [Plakobranchus ocellatus]|uniref:Uncharacterized protein n=1 Tax=Plakobranchus ocellatus TaxID=259542 RepID=A0AAV4DKN3_9GAST|nr:hypothetical protein PoB_007124100 [Plakobranchus ocellatus]
MMELMTAVAATGAFPHFLCIGNLVADDFVMGRLLVTSPVDASSTLDGPPCLAPFLSYPLLAASEQPATTLCYCAAFGENTLGNAEQCTSHQRADS